MKPTPEILEMLRRDSGLGLTRDAEWHIRGEAVTHQRIIDTLDQGLEVREDGEVIVRVGEQWAYVTVEDTAFVVRNIVPQEESEGGAPHFIELILNNGRRERLEPETLTLKDTGALYCLIQNRKVPARFLRAAYHNLLPFLIQHGEGFEGFALQLASGPAPIAQESDEDR